MCGCLIDSVLEDTQSCIIAGPAKPNRAVKGVRAGPVTDARPVLSVVTGEMSRTGIGWG